MSSITDFYRQIRRKLRNQFSERYILYTSVLRLFNSHRVVKPDTEIVIEGYPRSGNSFAEAAFRMAQNRGVNMGHHTHAVGQVIAAVHRGIPVILLFRNPDDTAVSRVLMTKELTLKQAYSEYTRFYKLLQPYWDRVILTPFEVVISRFGDVIVLLNQEYSTSFHVFDHCSDHANHTAKQLVDELSLQRSKRLPPYSDNNSSEYLDDRKAQKKKLNNEIRKLQDSSHIKNAYSVYRLMQKNTSFAAEFI